MSHAAQQVTAVAPRWLVRALFIALFVIACLLLSHAAADADTRERGVRGVAPADAAGDAVASTRGGADEARELARPVGDVAREVQEPVGDAVSDAKETGRRAAQDTVGAGEDVVREAAGTVDDTVDRVRSVAQETTRQVAEVVEPADPPVAPGRPAHQAPDVVADASPSKGAAQESLVSKENPALLVVPARPSLDLVEAAATVVGSTLVESLAAPVPPPAPLAGETAGETPPVHGGPGQIAPTPTPAAYLVDAVTPSSLELVSGVLEGALIPPADRATSPGTTPD